MAWKWMTENFGSLANWASIVGLLVSFATLVVASKVRRRLLRFSDIRDFNELRISRVQSLQKTLAFSVGSNIVDANVIGQVYTNAQLLQRYRKLFGWFDRLRLWSCIQAFKRMDTRSRNYNTLDKYFKRENGRFVGWYGYVVSMFDKRIGEVQ